MRHHIRRSALASPALAILLLVNPAPASQPGQATSYSADYSVSFLGIPVARATFSTSINGNGEVNVRGSVRSAGAARLFSNIHGTSTTTGRLDGDGVRPSSFDVSYVNGRRQYSVAVRFADGRVVAHEQQPPPGPRRSDWIPVGPEHLTAVVDPIAATIIRADRAEDVCRRTIPVFDGWMRSELRLEPVSTGPIRGRPGNGAVCAGRFIPVAGYRSENRDMRFMRDRGSLRISFAPMEGSDLFAPVEATIATRVGQIHVTAGPITRQ